MDGLIHPFGPDWHLLLAYGVNFGVLAVVLSWLLYKPVLRMVAERQRVIAKGVEDAQEAETKLKEADQTVSKLVSVAETEASQIVDSARAAASDEKSRILKEAEARAAQVAKDADARATETAAKALRESEKEIARLAVLAAAKAMGEN